MFEFTYTLPCGCDADDPVCTHRADQAEAEPDEAPADPKPTDWEADIWQGLTPVPPEDVANCMATEFGGDVEEHEPRGERKTFAEACSAEEGLTIFVTDDRVVLTHHDYGIFADDEDDPDMAEDGDARVHAVHQVDPDQLLTLLLLGLHEHGVDVDALLAAKAWEEMEAVLSVLDEPNGPELTAGMKLVIAERRRQVEEEGWTPEHDREHSRGELAQAAGCYALSPMSPEPPAAWPWDTCWWKPVTSNALRAVVKAAALLVAELDRLLAEE